MKLVKDFQMKPSQIEERPSKTPMAGIFLEEKRTQGETQGSQMKMEAEIEARQPEAREHLEPPEAGRGKDGFSPMRLQRACPFWP